MRLDKLREGAMGMAYPDRRSVRAERTHAARSETCGWLARPLPTLKPLDPGIHTSSS